MDLFSIFKGGKYFDKHMAPKCDYCQFGRRAKDGNKVLCEKRGLVDCNYSCSKFIYSPLKRIPVKQLNFVGSLADEDIYIESAGDIAEKMELENPQKKDEPKKEAAKNNAPNSQEAPKPAETPKADASAQAAPQQTEAPKAESGSQQNTAPKADAPVQSDSQQAEAPKNETVPAPAADANKSPANSSIAEMNALAEAAAMAAETDNDTDAQ